MKPFFKFILFVSFFYLAVRAVPYHSGNAEFIGVESLDDNVVGSVYRPPFSSDYIVTDKSGAEIVVSPDSYRVMVVKNSEKPIHAKAVVDVILSYIPLFAIMLVWLAYPVLVICRAYKTNYAT